MMRTLLLAAILALPGALASAADNPLTRFRAISAPDCAGPANFVAEEQGAPLDQTYMRVQHIGAPYSEALDFEVANPVTWNVGELTGFDARGYAGAQRGFRDAGPPVAASAFQLHCARAGFLINTWQFDHSSPLFGEGPSVSIARDFAPFRPAFANHASIAMEADVKVPWIANERVPVAAGTAQVSFFYYAWDSRSGKYIAQLAQLFENRAPGVGGSGVENIDNDGIVNFAVSPLARLDALGHPVRYVTVASDGPQMQYQHPWSEPRHFRAVVTWANFAAVLADLRVRQPELSPDPADYRLVMFGILGEVFPGTGDEDNVALAGSVDNLSLSEVPFSAVRLEGRSPLPGPDR
jgi:hypothetical protein